jgi:lysyl-tRNA synthetase class 2
VREFFERQDFLEVDSPTLVSSPGTEAHLDFFETEFVMGKERQKLYLPPSPELSLKKRLAEGYGNLFELKLCFRNGERSPIHRPEFWMLEWYREGGLLEHILKDCVELVQFLRSKLWGETSPVRVAVTTWRELFRSCFGVEIHPELDFELLKSLCERKGLRIPPSSSADDLFHLLVIERIEPQLDPEVLTFIKDYPPSQAALARVGEKGWAQRFELFWQGMELANAYQELNDPRIQRARAIAENAARVRQGKPAMPLDEEFFKALEMGLPPSAGVALGLERLFLALCGLKDIEQIRVD